MTVPTAAIEQNGQTIVLPGTGASVPSAVEQATAAALANIAAGKSADGQVRASDGTFAPPLPEGTPAAAPATGQPPVAPAAPAEGQTPPPEGDAPVDDLVVRLDGDGEEIEVEFADPAIAARFREMHEVAQQAETISQDAQRQIDDVLAVRESVTVDPVGFVLSNVADNPKAVEHLLLSLVTRPENADLLKRVAALATNPGELRITVAEQASERTRFAQEAQEAVAEQRAVSQNTQEIRAAVAAILPTNLTPQQQQVLYADMLRDVSGYAHRHKLMTLPVTDLPLVLAARLTANGINPADAAGRMVQAASRRGPRTRVAPAAVTRTAASTGTPAPRAAAPTGPQFVASAASRRVAASIPPAGAGSPGNADLVLPLNADGSKKNGAEALAWHREQHNLGRKFMQPAGT